MQKVFLMAATVLLIAAGGGAQTPDTGPGPLVRQTFAKDTDGWIAIGEITKALRTDDPALVRTKGASALRFEYTVDKRFFSALVLPVAPPLSLDKAGSVRFAVRPDTTTTLACFLQEKDGGRFVALFHAVGGAWQDVQFAPSDFLLSREKGDPADANGTLDGDKIESVAVSDLAMLFVRDEALGKALFGVTPGPRALSLADFEVSARPLTAAGIDGLARPQVGWTGFGGAGLKRVTDGPLAGPALELSTHAAPATFVGAVRAFGPGAFSRADSLELSVAATLSATLLVQLEDDRGGKWNATVTVPALKSPKKVTLPLADFRAADDSKAPGPMEKARLKQLVLLDVSGLYDSVDQRNTLWVNGIAAR
jgi:hypothetical protein